MGLSFSNAPLSIDKSAFPWMFIGTKAHLFYGKMLWVIIEQGIITRTYFIKRWVW